MLISYNTSKYFFICTFNLWIAVQFCEFLWVKVNCLEIWALQRYVGLKLKQSNLPLYWAPLSDGSRPWGVGGWSSRPWYKGLGSGLKKKISAFLASVCSRNVGGCPLPSGICHCLYEMNSSVTNIHVISKVPKPKQFLPLLCGWYPVPLKSSNVLQHWAALQKKSNLG